MRKFRFTIAAATLFAAFTAPLFGGTDLPTYVPVGVDAIVHINGEKIFATKAFQAFRKTAEYESIVKDAAKDGVDFDRAIGTGQCCIFVNANSLMGKEGEAEAVTILYRSTGINVGAVFESLKAEQKKSCDQELEYIRKHNARKDFYVIPKFSAHDVEGRPAFVNVDEDGCMSAILTDGNTMQVSLCDTAGGLILNPLKQGAATKLTAAVDTDALVSAAWQVDIPKSFIDKQGDEPEAKIFAGIVGGLEIVTLSVYESGESLEAKLVGVYAGEEQARNAYDNLVALRQIAITVLSGSDRHEDKTALALIKELNFARDGKKVIVSAKYPQDELVKIIETNDKEERERLRKHEELKKEEELKKREASAR